MGLLMRNGVEYTGNGARDLNSLSDVAIDTTTLTDGQALVYDATNNEFINGEVVSGIDVSESNGTLIFTRV